MPGLFFHPGHGSWLVSIQACPEKPGCYHDLGHTRPRAGMSPWTDGRARKGPGGGGVTETGNVQTSARRGRRTRRGPGAGERARVLTIALDSALLTRVSTALSGLEVEVFHTPDAQSALEHLSATPHRLVLCHFPLPHLLLRHFIDELRRPGFPSRHCGLIVLSIPELLSGARRFVGQGANVVLPRWIQVKELAHSIQTLLAAPSRHRPHPATTLRVTAPDGSPLPAGEIVNISATGLLVASPARPPIGERVTARLGHPAMDRPLEIPARVVRHTFPGREEVHGFALAYQNGRMDEELAVLVRD